ncbi:DUF2326 domain-containing protein [Bacillus thuringiensis]|uniref:DUF2326 domain-containing protein n=1 Tax=Bacillus thuringiensis TaxID=1428 RepID=UPI000A3A02BD|nr:DUF2326 domain-containing protein [Bacillus thuringiensis]MED3348229.1 DUF2326 domain-containing protein [Bacillus thuringiensis]MRB09099.1 DUF2326 domain-containing protein [Bacillus thuringiensis]OTW98572.1 hypothetical protein BK711_15960 [Bacillus thuringiensis serovar fukuokaensis]
MRLIRLSSNMNSFHTVEFKDGLNLIIGKQANPGDKNLDRTYNGVGKSLLIYILHFCLGSNKITPFEEKIPGWEFILEFSIDGELYTSVRNTSNQSKIFLNGEKLTLAKFRSIMLEKVFGVTEKINNLTFNTLFPRFIRRDRESYVTYDTFIKKEQEYGKVLNNSFLLGLETELVTEKQRLRTLIRQTKDLKTNIEQDPIIREHFNNNEDTEIEILDLEDNIERLKNEISEFKIAANYQELEKEADEKHYLLKELENKRTLINNSIKHITKSLEIKPDLSEKKVINLYNQANIEVPEMIVKRMEEAINFQKNLLKNRNKRLVNEKIKNQDKLKEIEALTEEVGKGLDKVLRYLDTHGALEDYNALNKKLNDMQTKLERLNQYQEILRTYKKKLKDVQSDFSVRNNETDNYLENIQGLLEEIMAIFRELSKAFYEKKPGGIKVINNDGDNTIRFDILAKIQDDSSDGVNEVKIFCFDMTILLLRQNHKFEFIFHDSRLFGNMDPRQRYSLFKVAYDKVNREGLQYIASINEDIIFSFKDLMTEDEYNKIIEESTRLVLTDESDKSKLLGIQVDMDYNK